MFDKKKQRISELSAACEMAKLDMDKASDKVRIASDEIVSIAHEIEYVDEELYKRLFAVVSTLDNTSAWIARAWAELVVALDSIDE